jgi:PIN domain nuclease of toxin-antitoxin system
VKLLLDTHTFLWFTLDDPRLSKAAADLMGEPTNELVLSVSSCWEIAIKISTGNACPILSIDEHFDAYGVQRIW